ncbi:MAG: F0F1 ATP synthase subunit gamma, partial [Gammaproteobacteria bacterium]|nr:F0F1 ATP synthase subunit gamma [Gammaproteobacteria bacterium]
MAGAKEIRTKIKSVKNMQKITKAMEMVSASKIRKAQNLMQASRPYAAKIRTVIGHLTQVNPDYRHPFLVERETKRVGYIIISTDRGLCGGLNTNLFKRVLKDMQEFQDQGIEVDLSLIGSKGLNFFRRFSKNIVSTVTHLGDTPHINDLFGSIKSMLDLYSEGKVDRLY